MPVVSNTSPILNLAIIGRLYLMREQFGTVLIPRAVLSELRSDEDLPGSSMIREALKAGWLKVRETSNNTLVRLLLRDLDTGEAEAIALALDLNAAWTLLDEREARKIAKSLGVRVTGLLGILTRAMLDGRIESLQAIMLELRDKAGFRIGTKLFSELSANFDGPDKFTA